MFMFIMLKYNIKSNMVSKEHKGGISQQMGKSKGVPWVKYSPPHVFGELVTLFTLCQVRNSQILTIFVCVQREKLSHYCEGTYSSCKPKYAIHDYVLGSFFSHSERKKKCNISHV